MSLTDTDKSSLDRGAPAPNSGDILVQHTALKTIAGGTQGNIGLSTITTDNVATNTLTGGVAGNIALSTLTTDNIAADTITANNIATGTITSNRIAAGAITTVEIAANTIEAGNIAASTITGNEISTLDLTAKALIADTGTIGGWTLGTTSIASSGGSVGMDSAETASDDIRFWAGNATPASAPFSVTREGALKASSATIIGSIRATAGSVLATSYLDGAIALLNLDVSAQGWSQTCLFSSTDQYTVAWSSGIFQTAGGTQYTISSGNTGHMAARTYIFLDINVSTTVLQITSDATACVGVGRVLIATAINNTNGAVFQAFGGTGGFNVDGSVINAGSILGNAIAANTITANNLSVSTLSAITANLGNVTSGTITLASGGFIRGGQTDYNTGSGFFLGTPLGGGSTVFSIGNSTAGQPALTWDGTALAIIGKFSTTTPMNIKAYATASLPGQPADTTTNSPSANANG
jgi:hypothetical protein